MIQSDRAPKGWHLWSWRWKVEPHGPTSIEDGYKIGMTLVVFLTPEGALAYSELEERWTNGMVGYPEKTQRWEPGWDFLAAGGISELISQKEVNWIWTYMRDKDAVVSPIRGSTGPTYIYPFPNSEFANGEEFFRNLLARCLKSPTPPPKYRDTRPLNQMRTGVSDFRERERVARPSATVWLLVLTFVAIAVCANAAHSPDSDVGLGFWWVTFSILAVPVYCILWTPAVALTSGLLWLIKRLENSSDS